MPLPSTAAVRLLTGEREPVRLATTGNIDVDTGGLLTIDGVVTEVGDRVLVKDQTDGSENGIRTASEGQWYRAADARTARTMQKGTTVRVQEGTANANKVFIFNTLDPVIGDDSLSIVEDFLSGAIPSVVRDYIDVPPYVATRTALKALDTTKDTVAILTESGREGTFIWRSGDFASLVTADAAEGLYVKADAIATTAGAWVRKRDNLDAQIEWFGGGAAMTAAVNDAAFASAKALSPVQTLLYGDGTYQVSTKMVLGRHGFSVKGFSAFPVYGVGVSGTTIKWTGAADAIIQIAEASGNDTYNNKITNIEFDGNALAIVGIDVINAQWPHVENCHVRNLSTSGTSLGLRTHTTAVAGTGINCVYRGVFKNLVLAVLASGIPLYISGTTGVGNTTFCVFENIHCMHKDNDATYISAADDCTFTNMATTRVAGGVGSALKIDGTQTSWVVGNTWYQLQCGAADGTTSVVATGSKSRQNKIYGLSGVDDAPTVTVSLGAHLQYDYLGTGYSSDLATESAMNRMAAAHITALRLGSDYTTYAAGSRDVNANDKVIWNNPGTGGWEWQLGGVASVNFTLAKIALSSFDASATLGPQLELFRDSASPAVSDTLGYMNFTGRSSNGTKRTYADFFPVIQDPTDGTEDVNLTMRVIIAGTLTTGFTMGTTFAVNMPATVNGNLTPQVNDTGSLGTGALSWSDAFLANGAVVNFNNGNYTITHTAGVLTFSGSVLSVGATSGIGYATGAGGAVTQLTSRTTGVTLNKVSGAITMFSAAGSATAATFTVTNSAVAATDTIILNQKSGTNLYVLAVTAVSAGSFAITFFTTGGVSVDAPVINFNVIKGVAA